MGLNSENSVSQDFAKQSDVLLYVDMTINDGSSCFNYYGNVWIPNKICFDTLADKKSTCNVRKASLPTDLPVTSDCALLCSALLAPSASFPSLFKKF